MDETTIGNTDSGEKARQFRRRTREAITERRAKVSDLYRQGLSQQKIAQTIGVDQGTISTDIHALIAEWGRTAGINISAHIATEFEKINKIEAESWAAYEASKGTKRWASASRRVMAVKGEDGTVIPFESTTASAREEHPATGDERFLARISWCVSERIKLFSLIKAGQEEEKSKEGHPTTWVQLIAREIAEREAKTINVTPKPPLLPEKKD